MNAIRKYGKDLTAGNFSLSDFFVESTYFDSTGRELICYLLSKMGCEMVANKLTGEKGVLFTAAYVLRFNQLETAEREREIAAYNKPRLGEFNAAVRNVLNGMTYTGATPKRVMNFLCGVYEPLGIEVLTDEVLTDGDYYTYHSVTQIARSAGLYSDTGRPHARAVAAIISKLDMPVAEHAIAVPYGLVGVSLRYDLHVEIAVCKWLIENRCPDEIPHLGFEYHVHYRDPAGYDDEPDGGDCEYDDFALYYDPNKEV
jgi:hypothetical protein